MHSCTIFFLNEIESETEDYRLRAGREGNINCKAALCVGDMRSCSCHSHLCLFFTFSPTVSLPSAHLLSPARTLQSYFLLACLLSKPAQCQCIRLIQSAVHRHSNVMTHDIQLMLFPLLDRLGQQ